uniref:Uncharacterized protein AlNc14C74G5004 n=1 Tax=Albugo laibachii Nc14 TaxID=890382 RepID=F0WEE7_9STRA|nr:conserved hypothetical protein [Albugo laibachii Nc14]|eukprot:CCA19579.1 conserved hypothetical protein [Albugo laibachii Nc14]
MQKHEIACCFVNFNAIYFYNLSTFRTKPNRIIRLTNHPSVGYKEITFMNSKRENNQGRSKSQLLAIDDDGCIRLWELQRNSQRLYWIIKTGLQHLFTAILIHNRHLLCGTHDGILTIYNIDDLVTPPFESLPTPRKIRSFNVIETGKHLWHRHSSAPRVIKITKLRDDFILCHFQHNWIAVINVIDWNIVQHFIGHGPSPKRELDPFREGLGCFSVLYKHPETRNMSRPIGFTVFNKAFYCMLSKDFGNTSILEVIDLCPPRGAQFGVNRSIQGEIPVCHERAREIRRLDRFRVPLDRAITLVTAHPSRHFLVGVSHTLKNLIIFDIVRT